RGAIHAGGPGWISHALLPVSTQQDPGGRRGRRDARRRARDRRLRPRLGPPGARRQRGDRRGILLQLSGPRPRAPDVAAARRAPRGRGADARQARRVGGGARADPRLPGEMVRPADARGEGRAGARAERAVGGRAVTRSDVRIASVYTREPVEPSQIHAMDRLRWLRISEGLADLGFSVDMIVEASQNLGSPRPTLRSVSPSRVDWSVYHVVKTLYPAGFQTLLETGGKKHPFILGRVGAVVGSTDSTPGVHFFGEERQALWEAHLMIRERARYVTLLTDASRALWQTQHGLHPPVLMVPTGVDREIPPRGRNP